MKAISLPKEHRSSPHRTVPHSNDKCTLQQRCFWASMAGFQKRWCPSSLPSRARNVWPRLFRNMTVRRFSCKLYLATRMKIKIPFPNTSKRVHFWHKIPTAQNIFLYPLIQQLSRTIVLSNFPERHQRKYCQKFKALCKSHLHTFAKSHFSPNYLQP